MFARDSDDEIVSKYLIQSYLRRKSSADRLLLPPSVPEKVYDVWENVKSFLRAEEILQSHVNNPQFRGRRDERLSCGFPSHIASATPLRSALYFFPAPLSATNSAPLYSIPLSAPLSAEMASGDKRWLLMVLLHTVVTYPEKKRGELRNSFRTREEAGGIVAADDSKSLFPWKPCHSNTIVYRSGGKEGTIYSAKVWLFH